jgi:hypothetical protein
MAPGVGQILIRNRVREEVPGEALLEALHDELVVAVLGAQSPLIVSDHPQE